MQFLYMARRDKHTVEFLSSSDFSKQGFYKRNIQMNEIEMDDAQKFILQKIYYPNRMDWEIVVEDATDLNTLRESLKKRGYKFVPPSFYHQIPRSKKSFIS